MSISKTNFKTKINYSNISITAYRAIKILKLLIEKPRSSAEIIGYLQKDEITNKSTSEDTLRITINSLKASGCDISRPSPANNYKYILNSHPFKKQLTKTQIKILLKIRQEFLNCNEWKKVIKINQLYDKISDMIKDEEISNLLSYKKPFSKIKPDVLKFFMEDKLEKKEVILTYNTSSQKSEIINIRTDYVYCQAGRLYIMAWYYKRNSFAYFNAEKISEIFSIKPIVQISENPDIKTIVYKITGDDVLTYKEAEDEKILVKEKNYIVVQATVKSEFKIFQRLLSFGSNFELISPDDMKQKLYEKLFKICARYE